MVYFYPLADGDGVASNWWHRSPNALNANNFSNTNSNGNINNNNANNRNGVCLGFCRVLWTDRVIER